MPILILAFVGLYAGSAMGDQFLPIGTIEPTAAFGVVLKALPIVVAAFALLGALAASISTSTTALIGASSTAVRDLYQRYVRPTATSKELTFPSKVITLILGLIVWLLCFYPGGPLYLFAFSTAWLGAPSILVFLGMWWKRTTKTGAFYGAVVGISATAIFTVLDLTGIFPLGAYTHVGVVGLVATVLTTVIVSLLTEPDYYARKGFVKSTTNELSDDEKKVMTFIHYGYDTMAEISDMLGVDSSISNTIVENLDKKQLIGRKKYSGPGFYTFHIQKDVPIELFLPVEGRHYMDNQLTVEDFSFLEKIQDGLDVLNTHIQQTELDSLHASAILSKLIKQGYLIETGLWRRKVSLSSKGREVIKKYQAAPIDTPKTLQQVL